MATVLDVILQAQVTGLDDFSTNLRKAAERSLDLDYSRLERGFAKAGKQFQDIMSKAVDLDVKFDMTGLRDLRRDYTRQMSDAARDVATLQRQLDTGNLDAATKIRKQNQIQEHKNKMSLLDKEFKKSMGKQEKLMDAAAEHVKLLKRGYGEAATELADGLESATKDFTSNLMSMDFGSMFKQFGKGAQGMGKRMQGRGAVQGGKMGKMMGGLGKAVGALGPALLAIGASVGALVAVVAIFAKAIDQAAEFNKTLVEASGGAELLAGGLGNIQQTMNDIRKNALSNAFTMRTMAKDQLEILGAYAATGLTFKEMAGDLTNSAVAMQRYTRATEIALTYSRLLGEDAKSIAEAMANYVEDLGADLEYVGKAFSNITTMAMESGFGVKRFYGMVLQATSGMSMYNVRLEEAGGLLIRIGRILGSKVGGDFLATLGKGFVDESMQDRFRRVLLTGRGRTQEAYTQTAADTGQDFLNKWRSGGNDQVIDAMVARDRAGNRPGGLHQTDAQLEAAGHRDAGRSQLDRALLQAIPELRAGLADGAEISQEHMVSVLQGASSEDRTRMLAAFEQATGSEDMRRELRSLIQVSEASGGSLDAMVRNLGQLDMGGKLNMLLGSGARLFGGEELHNLSALQLAAIENSAGLSGEQLEQMIALSEGFRGNFSLMQEIAANEQRYAGMNADALRDEFVRQTEQFGGYITSDGQFLAASISTDMDGTRRAVGQQAADANGVMQDVTQNLSEANGYSRYIQSQGDRMEGMMEQNNVDANLAAAQTIADNTFKITDILEMGIQWVLEQIYGVVQGLFNFFVRSDRPNKAAASEGLRTRQMAARESAMGHGRNIRGMQRQLREGGLTETEVRDLEHRIATETVAQERQQGAAVLYGSAAQQVLQTDGMEQSDDFWDRVGNWATGADNAGQAAGISQDRFAEMALQIAGGDPAVMSRMQSVAPNLAQAMGNYGTADAMQRRESGQVVDDRLNMTLDATNQSANNLTGALQNSAVWATRQTNEGWLDFNAPLLGTGDIGHNVGGLTRAGGFASQSLVLTNAQGEEIQVDFQHWGQMIAAAQADHLEANARRYITGHGEVTVPPRGTNQEFGTNSGMSGVGQGNFTPADVRAAIWREFGIMFQPHGGSPQGTRPTENVAARSGNMDGGIGNLWNVFDVTDEWRNEQHRPTGVRQSLPSSHMSLMPGGLETWQSEGERLARMNPENRPVMGSGSDLAAEEFYRNTSTVNYTTTRRHTDSVHGGRGELNVAASGMPVDTSMGLPAAARQAAAFDPSNIPREDRVLLGNIATTLGAEGEEDEPSYFSKAAEAAQAAEEANLTGADRREAILNAMGPEGRRRFDEEMRVEESRWDAYERLRADLPEEIGAELETAMTNSEKRAGGQQLGRMLGYSGQQLEQFEQRHMSGSYSRGGTHSDVARAHRMEARVGQSRWAQLVGGAGGDLERLTTPAAPDFIYRGTSHGGRITPIHGRDEILAMGHPGGPLATGARGRGGRGGGAGQAIRFEVNNFTDQRRMLTAMQRILKDGGYNIR